MVLAVQAQEAEVGKWDWESFKQEFRRKETEHSQMKQVHKCFKRLKSLVAHDKYVKCLFGVMTHDFDQLEGLEKEDVDAHFEHMSLFIRDYLHEKNRKSSYSLRDMFDDHFTGAVDAFVKQRQEEFNKEYTQDYVAQTDL